MKRSLGMLLVLALVMLSLQGCTKKATDVPTGSAPAASSGTGATKDKKTIVLSTIAGYYTTALNETAKAYTKLHPETEVKIEIVASNEAYKAGFDTKMAAGGKDAPDIVHTNLLGDLGDYVEKGWLLKLNDFVNEPNEYNGGKTVFEGIDPNYHQYSFDRNGNVGNLTFDLVGTGFFYNKDIFTKVGITEPTTWEELFAAGDKLKAAGYIPISETISTEGWLQEAFIDWNARALYTDMLILPGDARYDEKVHKHNTEIKFDGSNPDFDFGAIFDPEKVALETNTKKYNNQGPQEVKFWNTLKQLSTYYQEGYQTADGPTAYNLFISQKAAIYLNGSWQVGTMLADQKKLGDKAFKWGTFKFPKYATPDPLFPGEPRGILVPGHLMGISDKKDIEQTKRAEDFLKYMYSKDVAQQIFQRTLEVGEFVQGPSLVLGVTLPEEVNTYLAGFKVAGNMNGVLLNPSSGFIPDQQAAWNENRLKFYTGKITVEEFLKNKGKFAQDLTNKNIKDNKLDLDPKTNP